MACCLLVSWFRVKEANVSVLHRETQTSLSPWCFTAACSRRLVPSKRVNAAPLNVSVSVSIVSTPAPPVNESSVSRPESLWCQSAEHCGHSDTELIMFNLLLSEEAGRKIDNNTRWEISKGLYCFLDWDKAHPEPRHVRDKWTEDVTSKTQVYWYSGELLKYSGIGPCFFGASK